MGKDNNKIYKEFIEIFENNESQRGLDTIYGIKQYAAYILDKIDPPKNAEILDVGCGDGFIMKEIKKYRPGLKIHGLEEAKI